MIQYLEKKDSPGVNFWNIKKTCKAIYNNKQYIIIKTIYNLHNPSIEWLCKLYIALIIIYFVYVFNQAVFEINLVWFIWNVW